MPRQPPQLSVHLHTLSPIGPIPLLDKLVELNIPALEIPIRVSGTSNRFEETPLVTDQSTPTEIDELRRAFESKQARVAACSISAAGLIESAVAERVVRQLSIARDLGSPLVAMELGAAAETDPDQHQVIAAVRALADTAHTMGLLLAIDFGRGMLPNHRFLQHFLRQVDHPRVRASYDPGILHMLNEEIYSEVSLAKMCHLVKHVRLRESTGRFGQRDFPTLGTGSGCVNFLRIYQTLRDTGYRGAWSIVIEPANQSSTSSEASVLQPIIDSVAYLKRIGALDDY